MLLDSKVGKQSNSSGAQANLRSNREGDLLVSENLPRFYQKVAEGDVFSATTPLAGVTLAATHTTATLGATATPIITIFNGGTLNIAINRTYLATLSGTPAAGSYYWYVAPTQVGSALTLLTDTTINNKTFITDTPSGVKIGYGKALTGLVGNLTQLRPAGTLNTVTASLGFIDDKTEGVVIVPPNGLIALMATATGTTHVVNASVELIKVENIS